MQTTKVEKHFDEVAKNYDSYKNKNSFYYDNLKKLLRSLIPTGSQVLEIGCGTGELLASVNPKKGIGFDISGEMVKIAKLKYKSKKNLLFTAVFPSTINNQLSTSDYIFMSDVIEHLDDPQKMFRKINALMHDKTKFIITMANPIWEPVLMIGEKLGMKMPEGPHKRIRYRDIKILSEKMEMKIIRHDYKILVPIKIPLVTNFANKYLEKLFKPLCFVEYFVVTKA